MKYKIKIKSVLHTHGSNNPNGVTGNGDRIAMHPYFVFKDGVTIIAFLLVLIVIVCWYPNVLGQKMAVNSSNTINNYSTICWNDLYLSYTPIISVFTPYRVKITNKNIKSAGNSIASNYRREARARIGAERVFAPLCEGRGTSETTRAKTYYSNLTKSKLPSESNKLDNCLAIPFPPFAGGTEGGTSALHIDKEKNKNFYWLAGLIDGDGSLLVNKNGYATIEITLHERDVRTLYKIKKLVQGKVTARTKTRAYRWRLNNYAILLFIYCNLYDKLFCEGKHYQLCKFYEALNNNYTSLRSKETLKKFNLPLPPCFKRFKESTDVVAALPFQCKALDRFTEGIAENSSHLFMEALKNGWLSGFTDAEGYFSIRNKYTLTISISQKNKLILEQIKNFICIGNIYFDSRGECYNLVISDLKGIKVMLNYFKTFPLQTTKHIDCITFQRLVLFLERKYHLASENSKEKLRIDNLITKFKNRYKI